MNETSQRRVLAHRTFTAGEFVDLTRPAQKAVLASLRAELAHKGHLVGEYALVADFAPMSDGVALQAVAIEDFDRPLPHDDRGIV